LIISDVPDLASSVGLNDGARLDLHYARWVIDDREPELHVGEEFDWFAVSFWSDSPLLRSMESTKSAVLIADGRYRVNAEVTLGALLFFAGGVISLAHPQMLVSTHDEISSAARIYAGYVASRDLALAILLFYLLLAAAKRALSQLLVLVSLIQIFDAIKEVAMKDTLP
jgi:hypothetical protein